MTTEQLDRKLRVEERLKSSQGDLDTFEGQINLPSVPDESSQVNKYFTMSRDELEKLTRDDCSNIAYELAQYSYWVQRTINRENSKVSWSEAALNIYVGKHGNKFRSDKYMSYEELKNVVVANDSHAAELHAQKMSAKLKVDRLFFLSGKIEFMSKVIKDLKIKND